jgi:hypothetical protein
LVAEFFDRLFCLSHLFSILVIAAESTEFLHLILSGNDEEYNTATEFQVWDFLDFYVTEKFSAQQFDNLMGFTNEVLPIMNV